VRFGIEDRATIPREDDKDDFGVTTGLTSTLQTAIQHHRGGRLGHAERLYREVLAQDPNHAAAAFLLGVLGMESGRVDAAVEMFTRAITLAPDNAAYHANLGEAERRLGHNSTAAAAFLKAMSLKPDLAAPHYNLGLVLRDIGDFDGAVACFERAAELEPTLPDVKQRLAGARDDLRRKTAERRPGSPDASSASTLVELGTSLAAQGRREDGMALVRRALDLDPRLTAGHCNLGYMLADGDQFDDAIASFRAALGLDPDLPEVHNNLGNIQMKSGLLDEALASYRTSLQLRPDDAVHRSNLVYNLHYHPSYDARAILEEARGWDVRHGQPLAPKVAAHDRDRTPDRRLRVGYVSPDFRHHCQSFFLFPLLAHHDHESFEIFCYSDVTQPDEFTQRLLGYADQWRSIVAMDSGTAAARIREDRIDILVDLTMHMERNRLRVFARKPAPIQISWLAYPGTTGMRAIDYRVTDPFLDPVGSDTTVYAETSLRLADTFWCYHPLTSEETVSPLPARSNGHIRFGCLNNFCKVNEAVIALWARVLRAVAGSKLVLLAPQGQARRRTLTKFEQQGISADRIELVGQQGRLAYLATYRGIDVCLDTFPYNGHTTSLDAFWMGVPVVTLAGRTVAGRAGLCQAMNLGLPELVARTPDEYVTIVAGLCRDLDRLGELRAGLRARMEASPLMDAPRFARNLEAAYRSVWKKWCESAG
jgi:protein O-GlcNAc transferase